MRGAHPERALEDAVAREVSLAPGEIALVAASGGADSTALAALLVRAATAAGATVVLGHVNHALRASAWQDEAVVLSLGAALGARVVATSLPPGSTAEARLREGRYAALARIARDVGATRVFTGHHAGDQSETVLLALFRGAGTSGLIGIAPTRGLVPGVDLVRPLLRVEPDDLRGYCAANHLPYAVDPTNVDPAYRRNAVRAALVELRVAFPHLDAAVARCAAIVREERDGAPRALLRERLRAELTFAAGDARDVTFERLDAAARAVERGVPGRHFLRRGVEVVVE